MPIGRSSRNFSKGMETLCHNVYVDSPIMSRKHAVIYKGRELDKVCRCQL